MNGSINDEIVRVHKSEQCHLAKQVFDLIMRFVLNDGKEKGGNAIIVSQWKKENDEPKYERLFCESS